MELVARIVGWEGTALVIGDVVTDERRAWLPPTALLPRIVCCPDGQWLAWSTRDGVFELADGAGGSAALPGLAEGPFRIDFAPGDGDRFDIVVDGRRLRPAGFAIAGPAVVTAVHLFLHAVNRWEERPSVRCPWCRERAPAAPEALDAMAEIVRAAGDGLGAPCFELPADAWSEPGLLSACGRCRRPLRYNPFVVDERGRRAGR
jgi:hypothetical protein